MENGNVRNFYQALLFKEQRYRQNYKNKQKKLGKNNLFSQNALTPPSITNRISL